MTEVISLNNPVEITVYIAGDYETTRQACREFCMNEGLCVTVSPTTYIYTGGEELGVKIGLINYPRFPKNEEELYGQANRLGMFLMERLCQVSFTINTPNRVSWYSRRKDIEEKK